jgi:cysteine desulfurase
VRIYFDYNATAPVRAEAVEAALVAMQAWAGNPASPHAEGRAARRALEGARKEVAALVGAAPEEVVFTSGGSEANAAAIWGLLAAGGVSAGRRLVLSAVEHPSLVAMAEGMQALGVEVRTAAVDEEGRLHLASLAECLEGARGAVACVQLANSETGVLQGVAAAAALCAERGAHLHCDAVQAAGKVPLSFAELGVDTLALSGHKFGAPPGVGALVVKGGVELVPLIAGSQEGHRRGGTENLPGIVAFGVAARLAAARVGEWQRVAALREAFESEVATLLPGTRVMGAGTPRLANTSCLILAAPLGGTATVAACDLAGVAVAAGPACSSGAERPSRTLLAMGLDNEAARRTLRVSLGLETSAEEVDRLARTLQRIAERTGEGER